MKYLFIFFILFSIGAAYERQACAQPLAEAKYFAESKTFKKSRRSVCCKMLEGEYYKRDFDFYLAGSGHKEYEQVYATDTTALVKVRVKKENLLDSSVTEFYLYMVIKGAILNEYWKIEDYRIRTLPIAWETQKMFELAAAKGYETAASIERIKLFTSPDSVKAKYFYYNKDRFESARMWGEILTGYYLQGIEYDSAMQTASSLGSHPPLPALTISGVAKDIYNVTEDIHQYPGVTFFEIDHYDGVMEGYLYVKDENTLPRDNKIFVMMETLGEGWYMYRALDRIIR
jgi:hypothetical protein